MVSPLSGSYAAGFYTISHSWWEVRGNDASLSSCSSCSRLRHCGRPPQENMLPNQTAIVMQARSH